MTQELNINTIHMSQPDINCKYPEDWHLVQKVLAGDKDAIGKFLTENCYHIFQFVKIRRLNSLDLEPYDLVSDFYIFLSANDWKVLRTFRFESKLQTWINLVASRYLIKLYKKELQENAKENPPISEKTLLSLASNEKKLTRFELADLIGKLTNNRDKQMLEYTLMGFETEEISKLMHVSKNNVYVLRNRAINNLKRLLNEDK